MPTAKQEERIRNKIARIRKELAADRKFWGGYHHDGTGLRYLPPKEFIKLRDYKGGMRYLHWFNRTFPDDIGHPVFLLEWTLILFKTGKLKEAEKKAYDTHHSNNYLLEKFLGKELPVSKQNKNLEWEASQAKNLKYSSNDPEFTDFAEWLENLLAR